MTKRSYDRELKKKPPNKEAQEMDVKEGKPQPPKGPPPVKQVYEYEGRCMSTRVERKK